MNKTLHALTSPSGREARRLRRKFTVKDIHVEHGLHARLRAACGSQSELGLALGSVLHRHACGVYGPLPKSDRALNDYVVRDAVLRGGRHHVISLHTVRTIAMRLSTNLATGATTVRLAEIKPSIG